MKFHCEMNRTDSSVDIQLLQIQKKTLGTDWPLNKLVVWCQRAIWVVACKVDCQSHFRTKGHKEEACLITYTSVDQWRVDGSLLNSVKIYSWASLPVIL